MFSPRKKYKGQNNTGIRPRMPRDSFGFSVLEALITHRTPKEGGLFPCRVTSSQLAFYYQAGLDRQSDHQRFALNRLCPPQAPAGTRH